MGKHHEAMLCFKKARTIGKEVIGFLNDGRPVYEQ